MKAKDNTIRVSTVDELARILGVDKERLFEVAGCISRFYHQEKRPKPDGSGRIRVLNIPHGELKEIQARIHRHFLKRIPIHDMIHSYRKGRSIFTNARLHVNKEALVYLDITDHFPSVTQEMVFKVYLRWGCPGDVARLLTRLTSYKNQLPQGAPTSSALANLVAESTATRIQGLADKHHLTPSIYGDDISVSGGKRAVKLKKVLETIVRDEGFKVSDDPQKTGTSTARDRMTVTRLVVNDGKARAPREYHRRVRAIIHQLKTRGATKGFPADPKKAKEKLQGMISHVKTGDQKLGSKLFQEFKLINWDSLTAKSLTMKSQS